MLIAASKEHLQGMMSWFTDHPGVTAWGGPAFRFPYTEQSFYDDSKAGSLPSYVLVDEAGALLAFGQYYERLRRCHLSRLAVNPQVRGQGLGTQLIASLVRIGAPHLGAAECSLFVSTHNPQARRLYHRLGFVELPYPEPHSGVPDSYYMIAPIERIAP